MPRRALTSDVSRETRSLPKSKPIKSASARCRPGVLDPEAIGSAVSEIVQAEVSRLDLELPPAFFARIRMYGVLLAVWGEKMSLTARPSDADDLAFHVIDSLMPYVMSDRGKIPALAKAFTPDSEVLDLGSGAGFPGLVLAAASRAHFTLCESRRKRASFLAVTAEELGLFDLTVMGDRATPRTFEAKYHLVTTRAVGDAGDFHAVARAALKPGGIAMLYASSRQAAEMAESQAAGLQLVTDDSYELSRDGESVRRALVLWRKT
ncbi:MAG: class I SAM-dependent methyltransferase [Candidatus Binataceae bacterium]|nr:class I SAM-dependent methyltransferase [Candidatus Binataceae bacterium]